MLLVVGLVSAVVLTVVYYMGHEKWKNISESSISYHIKYHILGFTSLLDDIYNRKNNHIDLSSMPGKVAIITGGSRGIGAKIVKNLLQCDMEVIIACRTPVTGKNTILEIRKSGVTSGQAKVYELNNLSLKSVREFAQRIKKDYDKIHILINNAGVMFAPYKKTEDGFEEQWAVNYLSHFLLTSLLLPLLKAASRSDDCSRIVNVSSCAHIFGNINFDNNYSKNKFVTHAAYSQSKLAQVMFTIRLQKLLAEKSLNIQVYSVHPGVVNTGIFVNSYLSKAKWFMMHILKTAEQGAIPVLYAAVSKDIEKKGGLYIDNCKERSVAPAALKPEHQKQLFEISLKQAQLNDFFQYL